MIAHLTRPNLFLRAIRATPILRGARTDDPTQQDDDDSIHEMHGWDLLHRVVTAFVTSFFRCSCVEGDLMTWNVHTATVAV